MKDLKFIIYFKTFIILCFLFSFGFCDAQKLWTLQDCIDYAKKNNFNIKQQELNVKSSEYDRIKSYGNLLPTINGYANHQYQYGQTIVQYTNEFAKSMVQSDNFYLSSSLTLFNGFQNENAIKKSNTDLMAGRYDANKLTNDISLNIANAYLQILFNDEILKTNKDQLDIDNQQVDKNKKMFEAGTIAKGTLLQIEAQAATDELLVVNSQNTLDLSYLTLKQLLDLTPDIPFEISKPVIEIIDEEILKEKQEDIYEAALSTQPDIKSSELKLRSSELSEKIAKGMASPQLSLQASTGTGFSGLDLGVIGSTPTSELIGYTSEVPQINVENSKLQQIGQTVPGPSIPVFADYNVPIYDKIPFGNQLNQNMNKTIGLSLNIPVLNYLQNYTNINKTKIATKNAEYNLLITKNNLYKTIQQAYADAKAAFNKYNSTKKSMDAIEESYKYAEEKYDVGMLNFVDYNDAKTKLIKAKSDLLQAKYDYVFKIKVLEFYKGKPLYF